MRAGLLAVMVLVACGPRVSTGPQTFDEDLGAREPAASAATTRQPTGRPVEREIAPPGKGLRSGTVRRDRLIAVLDAGPAAFLRQIEVTPRMSGDQFLGWQLVQLVDPAGPLHDLDLVPGDVLLGINGKPLSRPDQLQSVWDSLRTANEIVAHLSRGDQKLELRFTIDPPVR